VVELRYSIVDKRLGSGNGMVIVNRKDVKVKSDVAGKLTAVRHANGNDLWIITQGIDGSFYSYLLTSAGWTTVPSPVVSTGTGVLNPMSVLGFGCLKPSNDGLTIAAAYYDFENWQLFDFNKTTGMLTHSLTLQAPVGAKPFDISFSPNNQVLYGSCYPLGTLQYNLAAGSSANVIASETVVGTAQFGLQLAPNGKIYGVISSSNSDHLDVINNPDEVGSSCNYTLNGYTLPSGKLVLQNLPNFPLNIFLNSSSAAAIDEIKRSRIFQIFPNPTSGIFSLMLNDIQLKSNDARISVYNELGTKVYSSNLAILNNKEVDLSALANGIYLVEIKDGANTYFNKVSLQQ
jgi:hypothetical protein